MSSLRDILKPIPQSPVHHPEGDVFTHTRMVRQSLNKALNLLKEAQKNPNSAFSKLNLDLKPDELNILRLAGWLHDIGKEATTAWTTEKGERLPWKELPPEPSLPGKGWQAIGHERPEKFEPVMQKLGPQWQKMYQNASQEDRDDLWFIIKKHMKFYRGFGKLDKEMIDNEGKYKDVRRYKLLLLLVLMDRLGRAGDWEKAPDGANRTVQEMEEIAVKALRKAAFQKQKQKELEAEKAAYATPEKMVKWWHEKEKPLYALPGALKGKFPWLTDEKIQDLIGG
jgi:hypothetical protein